MSEPTGAEPGRGSEPAGTTGPVGSAESPEPIGSFAEVDPSERAGEPVVDDVTDQPIETLDLTFADAEDLVGPLEAILFVVDSPVTVAALAAAVESPVPVVEQALTALRAGYDDRGAGIELREVAGGVRLYTRTEHAPAVEQFLLEGQRTRLSQAALETLAVIAYRQPVTRQRVSAIRGVNVDGVVRTLLARGLVVEDGADPDTGGGLFRTSTLFLERMGLQGLDELPSLAPLLPEIEGLDFDTELDTDLGAGRAPSPGLDETFIDDADVDAGTDAGSDGESGAGSGGGSDADADGPDAGAGPHREPGAEPVPAADEP